MQLIPTQNKEKLPSGYSYPTGAERISSILNDVPQYQNFRLHFAWRDEYWASKYASKVKSSGSIRILVVEKSRQPEWAIRVRAVPSSHASVARAGLDATLQTLRAQLLETKPDADWFQYSVAFDLASSKIVVR